MVYEVIFIRSYIKYICSIFHRDRICLHHSLHHLIIKQCDCSGTCYQKYLSTVTWICHMSLGCLFDGVQSWLVQNTCIGICWLSIIMWLCLHPCCPFYDKVTKVSHKLFGFFTNSYKLRELLLKVWDKSNLIRVLVSSVTLWIQLRWKAWVFSFTSQSFLPRLSSPRY